MLGRDLSGVINTQYFRKFFFVVAVFTGRLDGMKKRWVRLLVGAVCGLLSVGVYFLLVNSSLNACLDWLPRTVPWLAWWVFSVFGLSFYLLETIYGFVVPLMSLERELEGGGIMSISIDVFGFTTSWASRNVFFSFLFYLVFAVPWMVFFEMCHCVAWLFHQLRRERKYPRESSWKIALAVLFVLSVGISILLSTAFFVRCFLS